MSHIRTFLRILGYIALYFIATSVFTYIIWFTLGAIGIKFAGLTYEFIGDLIGLAFLIYFFKIYKKEVFHRLFPDRLKLSRILAVIGLSLLIRIIALVVILIGLVFILIYTDKSTLDGIMKSFTEGKDFQWSIFDGATQVEMILGYIAIIVLAPLLEELLLRGIIFNRFKKHYTLIPSIIFTNVIFMLMHVHPGLFIVTFIFGVVMTLVYVRWNNLAYPIILHMFLNMQPFLFDYFGGK